MHIARKSWAYYNEVSLCAPKTKAFLEIPYTTPHGIGNFYVVEKFLEDF